MIYRLLSLTTLCSLFSMNLLFAQNFTLSGYVKDGRSGETVTGVNVYNKANSQQGASTNAYGFYSLTLPKGKYTIKISFVGYADREIEVNLVENTQKNVEITEGVELQAVVVTAESKDKNVTKTEMGTVVLAIENIKRLPVLFGEADVLKVIQLLPGVKATEGSSGFYVRGGGIDQNLILLDEAIVYNPGHLLGFFSIFNADAIKNLTLIKGGMPAQYGGRLSSVVDIQMKEGNNQSFGAEGGIGLIASRLTLQGPIQKNKSSFIVSARRTYALDLAQRKIDQTKFAGSNYYFYDMNMKANYQFSERDRIYLSGYFGRDIFQFNSKNIGFNFRLPYGNATGTLRWNHVFNPKLFMNVSAIYNDYNFEAGGGQDVFKFKAFSGVRDFNGKVDFDYYHSVKHSVKFGLNYTFHRLTPNIVTASNADTVFTNSSLIKPKYANEVAAYVGDDWKVSPALTLNIGARLSAFQQIGPYTSAKTQKDFKRNEVVTTYSGFEPRLTGTYKFDAQSSLKFGVTATTQYLHLVSNSTSSFPSDIWVPSSEYIKPQRGVQYATGFFRNFNDNQWETSVEVYYKDLKNQIDYPESYVNNATTDVEQSYVFGKGRAYGAEFFIKKAKGRLNGWVGYTWSRTLREFKDINGGIEYPSTYDRIHDVVVVANYQISKKWEASGNFTYATGNTFTPLRNLYTIDQRLRLEYGDRNSLRYPNYNRMDVGATYTPKPDAKGFKSSWTFSVYNVYNRWNPFFVQYDVQSSFEKGTAKATAFAVTLFPIIPSITWNFKWNQKTQKDAPN
jgi:TonB dependent receptor/CarboxypepD_reg-like domain/TonB-dependent Receptor Plug Domain